MRSARNNKGFTLIELMIVVVIIGILAAIAIPRFTNVSKSAKEAEADGILKQAYSLQETYKQKNDEYASDDTELATVGWQSQTGKYYTVTVISGNATTFAVQANPAGDGITAGVSTKCITQGRVITTGACAGSGSSSSSSSSSSGT